MTAKPKPQTPHAARKRLTNRVLACAAGIEREQARLVKLLAELDALPKV